MEYNRKRIVTSQAHNRITIRPLANGFGTIVYYFKVPRIFTLANYIPVMK